MCFVFLRNFCSKHFSLQIFIELSARPHVAFNVTCLYCYVTVTGIGMCRHILLKLSSIKFYENIFGGSHDVTCGQTYIHTYIPTYVHTYIHTYTAKLIDDFLHVFVVNVLN
jgi:hypothetical protein